MRALAIAFLFWLAAPSHAAPLQGSSTAQGSVTAFMSGVPISGARVDLIRLDGTSPQTYTAVSQPDGSFTIANARPGAYRLAASRTGYLRREFGQRSRSGQGLTITIEASQQLPNLDVALRPAATITGRVTDIQGDAAAATEVRALAPYYKDGKRILGIVQSAISNDLGEYRLFGLAAGKYYVSAMPPGNSAVTTLIAAGAPVTGVSTKFSNETGAAVYYPGTTDSRLSTAIDVGNGGEYSGVNITLIPSKTYHIRGVVPGGTANVTLMPGDPGMSTLMRNALAQTGPFDFPSVAAGEYTLVARSGELLGLAAVNVTDHDIDNVTVGLSPTLPVPTRVHFEDRMPGENDPDLENANFNLLADPVIPGADPDLYGPFPNGALSLGVLPGMDYRITNLMMRLPGATPQARIHDAYIQSVRMGNRDVFKDGFRVDDPQKTTPIEIVLGLHPGTLSGTVTGEGQRLNVNATVLLVPDAGRRRWYDTNRTVTTDISGRFTFDRIAPGDYVLFSWEEIEDGAWLDPDFMKRYEERGKHIHINAGNNPPVNVTAIP